MGITDWIKRGIGRRYVDLDTSARRMNQRGGQAERDYEAMLAFLAQHRFKEVMYTMPPTDQAVWFWRQEWDEPRRFRLINAGPMFNIAGLYWTDNLAYGAEGKE